MQARLKEVRDGFEAEKNELEAKLKKSNSDIQKLKQRESLALEEVKEVRQRS